MSETSWIEAERARCRRPITPDEVAGLEALGHALRWYRWRVARLTRSDLAVRSELSVRQIEQIERGIRRTRRSTLERIAAVLAATVPELGEASDLADGLAELAGPALAPESIYRDRVEKRRKARNAKLRRSVSFRYTISRLRMRVGETSIPAPSMACRGVGSIPHERPRKGTQAASNPIRCGNGT